MQSLASEIASLANGVVATYREKSASVCTAESCTGGLISQSLTAVSGASEIFLGAFVTYDERMKTAWLGVLPETLRSAGAVSSACARQMAEGARARAGADVALSVTGFAGPGGGTERDPVGTVYLAVSTKEGTETHRFVFSGNRERVRHAACKEALKLLLSAAKTV